jgi:hypothetical protein
VWQPIEHLDAPTLEDKEASLRADNPYGRCVWRCDNDVVDHQSVVIEFADGSTATHNMVGGAAKASRSVHLIGTHGEIQGTFEEGRFVVRHLETRAGHPEYTEDVVDLHADGDHTGAFGGHGGGDMRMVADFVRLLRDEPRSISCTTLDDSVHGHQVGFAADRAMEEQQVVRLPVA